MPQYNHKGRQCHSAATKEGSATVLQRKAVPQYNYKGRQCHSTTAKEDSATVQLQRKTVPQYNCKGRQCHSTTAREDSATVQQQKKKCCRTTTKVAGVSTNQYHIYLREASATVQLQGKPVSQFTGSHCLSMRKTSTAVQGSCTIVLWNCTSASHTLCFIVTVVFGKVHSQLG